MSRLYLNLAKLIERCRAALLDSAPTAINHTDLVDLRKNRLPDALRKRSINVYALWTRKKGTSLWALKYIGQRSTNSCWRRVCEHLFHVNHRTESKLERVREALRDGYEIGITGILVEPDSLRLTLEDELIRLGSRDPGSLPWNRKSRAKVPSQVS